MALRDEALSDMVALNGALKPFLPPLYRLAARGHWIRERRPVRAPREAPVYGSSFVLAATGSARLTASIGSDGELFLALSLDERGVIYPIGPYPQNCEFVAMLDQLESGRPWNGVQFRASAHVSAATEPPQFQFRRHSDGVALAFSGADWKDLKTMFAAAMTEARLQTVLAELSLVYGDL